MTFIIDDQTAVSISTFPLLNKITYMISIVKMRWSDNCPFLIWKSLFLEQWLLYWNTALQALWVAPFGYKRCVRVLFMAAVESSRDCLVRCTCPGNGQLALTSDVKCEDDTDSFVSSRMVCFLSYYMVTCCMSLFKIVYLLCLVSRLSRIIFPSSSDIHIKHI